MRRLKLKLCSVLLVLLMGLSSLQGYAMYDPNALHGELVGGTVRITESKNMKCRPILKMEKRVSFCEESLHLTN